MNPSDPTITATRGGTELPALGPAWAERFFQAAVDPLAIVGYDGRFRRVNTFWTQLFGWSEQDLLARPYAEFVHPDDRQVLDEDVRGLIGGSPPRRDLELRFRCRDGSHRWLSVSGQASPDERLIHVVAKDITSRRRVEQALRHSEERFRSVITALEEGIVLQDADGVVQACNEAAERILRVRREDVLGRPAHDLVGDAVHEDGSPFPAEQRPTLHTLRTGEAGSGVVMGIPHGDETTWVLVSTHPLASPGDRAPRAVVTSIADITRRKSTEDAVREAEERFRTAFAAAPIGISLIGLDNRYLLVNPAMCELAGMPEEALLGRDFRTITHPEDVPAQEERNAGLLAGQRPSFAMEKRYLRADGAVTWALITSALIRDADGEPRCFVNQVVDVTDRKNAEQDLRRSNADLEQFASAASHDLREPLVVVKGYLELLTRRHAESLDEEGQRFLKTSVDAVDRMQGLISDLLEWSRAGAELRRGDVAAGQLATEALAAVEHHVQTHRTEVSIGPLPTVRAEATALRRVFQNLLSNAVKFGELERPKVSIEARREGSAWRFTVADSGPGIAPEDRERVFAMFERLGARQTGTGIGLAICRRIVERHGGRMWVDEAPGGGAAFHFTVED